MKKIFFSIIALASVFVACQKNTFDNTVTGEAIGDFRLTSPATSTNLVLNAATPNASVSITWTAAKPGLNTPITYNWVAALKTTGNLESPILSIPSNNSGAATTLTLTFKQIDDALASKGIAAGAKADLIWSVQADNGTTKLLSQDIFNISITRFGNGASPFLLLGPASSNATVTINPSSTTSSLSFNWTRSMPATGSPAVRYRVLFAERKVDGNGNELPVNWNMPLFAISSNNAGADTLANVTFKAMSDSLTNKGFTNAALPVSLKWTVVATSGTWNQLSDYQNTIALVREVNLFIVGGATPIGWTPTDAIQMIQDNSLPGVYFAYVNLTTGNNGFKFLGLKADWGASGQVEYGNSVDGVSGNNPSDNTGILSSKINGNGNAGNIAVPSAAGVYRIQVNLNTNRYNVVNKGVGMVGFVNGWNENAPIYMTYQSVNRFIILRDFTAGNEEFKFHDGVAGWGSGYGESNYFGQLSGQAYASNARKLTKPGDNIFQNDNPKPTAGRWRIIFDGTDPKNLSYSMSYANVMRIVGDAIDGGPVWNPATSPQMTYLGNGQWTITLNLIGGKNFKFVSASAWPDGGANDKFFFDYEDAGGGNVRDDGNDNFVAPGASGAVTSRTITLNEYTRKYTIN